MSNRAPAYRDPVLHFEALRLAVLREGGRIKQPLATENERKCLYAHLRTCHHPPRSSLQLGQAWSLLPAHSSNWLDDPCLASCSMNLGSNS